MLRTSSIFWNAKNRVGYYYVTTVGYCIISKNIRLNVSSMVCSCNAKQPHHRMHFLDCS
jgi:hypothetical protein